MRDAPEEVEAGDLADAVPVGEVVDSVVHRDVLGIGAVDDAARGDLRRRDVGKGLLLAQDGDELVQVGVRLLHHLLHPRVPALDVVVGAPGHSVHIPTVVLHGVDPLDLVVVDQGLQRLSRQ